jgi:Right handed beta helix region
MLRRTAVSMERRQVCEYMVVRIGIALALPSFAALTHAETIEITPADDFEVEANALSPGDELILHGGTYLFDGNVTVSVNGTAAEPILIRAADGETAVLRQATANHNVIEINGASYLVLRGIEVTGGSHGIRLISSDYVTIESCNVPDTGDVAISANSGGTYDGLRILHNELHHTNGTGEGLYLGCNNDDCRVANSLIEGNHIHDTNGPGVKQGDGIELKEGSYNNIVRDNLIHDTRHPGILSYSTVGNGAPNVIERNVIWSSSDYALQAAADVIVRNNIILGSIGFQAHQSGSPSNIELVHNTIVSSDDAVNVRDVSGAILIANNAVYSQRTAIRLISGATQLVTLASNVGEGGLSGANEGYTEGNGIGVDFVSASFAGVPPIDVFPAPGRALIGAGDAAHAVSEDFNATTRNGTADVGAYRFDPSGNPGWTIQEGFKELGPGPGDIVPAPPTDLTVE